jgi:hypothetical protein
MALALGFVVAARPSLGQSAHKATELAPGVYAIQHDNRDKYVSGNTTVISGDRQRFAGGNQDVAAEFDDMTGDLVRLVHNEAVLR